MIIAIPVSAGQLSPHFGHCEEFALIAVDLQKKELVSKETIQAPPHEPGFLPRWLHDQGANVIIAGGMGMRAQQLFQQNSIQVLVGAPVQDPESIVNSYLKGNLVTGDNLCDH